MEPDTTSPSSTTDTFLSAAQIIAADDITYAVADVPEWGGKVRLRALTGEARDAFEEAIASARKAGKQAPTNTRALLVSLSAVNAEGGLLFTPKEITALGQKSAAALNRVFEVASRLSGLSKADVEELEKNSAPAAGAASPSSSPAS